MKKFFGLCILVILLVAASGCTQPATSIPEPTATEIPTAAPTPVVTTPAATAEETAAPTITEEVTAEVTTVVTTEATPLPVMTYAKNPVIHIRNNTFVPQEIMVLPGTGVSWINDDRTVHAVKTLPNIGLKFSSSDLIYGAAFGYTFGDAEGTFGFTDPYTNATGIIIVKKGQSLLGAPTMQTPVPATTSK